MKQSIFDTQIQIVDLPSKIVAGLERISEAFRVLLWEDAKVVGLSPTQIQILIFLAFHPENFRNVSSLAREFNMTKATISDAIKTMVNKKLIEKIPSPTDKRAYSISITPQGSELVVRTMGFAEPLRHAVSGLDPDQQEDLHRAIIDLIYKLNKANILTVQRTCFNCRFYEWTPESHYCHYLRTDLSDKDLRVDCREFQGKS